MSLKSKANHLIAMAVNSVAQKDNERVQGSASGDEIRSLARQMGAEGVVLLKNEKNTLPLQPDETVSVFGRVQIDTFFVGYGSGGDVNAAYRVSILEGLRACKGIRLNEELAARYEDWAKANPIDEGFWGHLPMCYSLRNFLPSTTWTKKRRRRPPQTATAPWSFSAARRAKTAKTR